MVTALITIAAIAWITQLAFGGWQIRQFNRAFDRLCQQGRVGVGRSSGRFKPRAVVAIAATGGTPLDDVRRLGRPLDAGRRVADRQWLATVPDDPGAFLRLRLAAENDRRLSMGLTAPQEGDPW